MGWIRSALRVTLTLVTVVAATQPLGAWDFSGKTRFAAFEEIARRGRLDLAVDVADSTLKGFLCPPSATPLEALEALTRAENLRVVGGWQIRAVVSPESDLGKDNEPLLICLRADERPTELVLSGLNGFCPRWVQDSPKNPKEGAVWFPYAPRNLGMMVGDRSVLERQKELFAAADTSPTMGRMWPKSQDGAVLEDTPAAFLRVTLKPRSGALPDGGTAVSFLSIEDCPATLTWSVPGGKSQCVIRPTRQAGKPPEAVILASDPGLDFETKVEFLPDSLRLAASATLDSPITQQKPDSPFSPDPPPPAGTSFHELVMVGKPVVEIMERVFHPSSGSGWFCDEDCSATMSVFLFGPKNDYPESLVGEIAKVKGLSAQKIGNNWTIGNPLYQSGPHTEWALYITRRLQFVDAETVGRKLADFPLVPEKRDRVRCSPDPWSNGLLFTGPGGYSENVRRFVEFVDVQPRRLDLTLERGHPPAQSRDSFRVPSGVSFFRQLGEANATWSLRLFPVMLAEDGLAGCQYRSSTTVGKNGFTVEGWTFLPSEMTVPLVEGEGGTPGRIVIAGSLADPPRIRADKPGVSGGKGVDGSTAPSRPTQTGGEDATDTFDDAFDAAF